MAVFCFPILMHDHWILRLRGLIYMAGFVLIWGWLALTVRRWDVILGGPLPQSLASIGIAVMIAGGVLAGICIGLFIGPGKGTPAPFDPPRAFVATGPYRWVRNPMYIGGAGVLLGLGLWLRSPGIVGLTVIFLAVFHFFVVLYEEPTLRRQFGDSYESYLGRVRRWWPTIPK